METLVVAQHHKNRSCTRSGSKIHGRFRSSHTRGFGAVTCRSFDASGRGGVGILPSPPSPTIPLPPKKGVLSSPIPIPPKRSPSSPRSDDFSGSELFAGPAYSNSPPPSSLPIPKFSLRQKRSVSLDLAASRSAVIVHCQVAKSAPTSPKRDCSSPIGGFFISNAYATENLRRILHLDIGCDH